MNSSRRCAPARPLKGEDFPALREFCRGYLHQDFIAEHRSPERALAAYLAAAPAEARSALAREARALLARELPLPALQDFLTDHLDCAWHPRQPDHLIGFLSSLSHATHG